MLTFDTTASYMHYIYLLYQKFFKKSKWCGEWDLNPQNSVFETDA